MAISQSGDSTSIPSFLGVSCCRRRGVGVGVGVVPWYYCYGDGGAGGISKHSI